MLSAENGTFATLKFCHHRNILTYLAIKTIDGVHITQKIIGSSLGDFIFMVP